ncbi:hypothetical protein AMTRI_Chr11g151590 [Amborella trichopoda]
MYLTLYVSVSPTPLSPLLNILVMGLIYGRPFEDIAATLKSVCQQLVDTAKGSREIGNLGSELNCIRATLLMDPGPVTLQLKFLAQFISAGLTLFSKLAIKGGMNPFVFVVFRQAIASAVLGPFAYFFERITVSMDLYYIAFKYTTATFAAATSNAIPALTFLMAILLRMERLNMGYVHGQVKVVGAVICITWAFILSLYKGPPLKSLNLHHSSLHSTTSSTASEDDWVKGSILMLTCNATWALWLGASPPLIYPKKKKTIGHSVIKNHICDTIICGSMALDSVVIRATRLELDIKGSNPPCFLTHTQKQKEKFFGIKQGHSFGGFCDWSDVLVEFVVHREERPSLHSHVHTTCPPHNCNFFSLLMGRATVLGKVCYTN